MMEFALRAKGAEIYTIASLKDNFYLLDDLKPDLIIFDTETCQIELQELYEYSERTKTPLVAVGNEADRYEYQSRVHTYLTKPLEARNIGERLLSLLD